MVAEACARGGEGMRTAGGEYLTFFRQKLVIFVRTCTDDCVYKKWIFARKYDKISND